MKVVLLDRDGTIIVDPPDERVDSVEKIQLFPDTLEALRYLAEHEFAVILVTNQAGIAEGRISQAEFEIINAEVIRRIAPSGICILKTYVCPHTPEDGCDCRKARRSRPMKIIQKVQALGLPKNSFVVVGGGVLVALGLLEWDGDIDLAVTLEVFENLKAQNWQQEGWRGKMVLKYAEFDVGVDFGEWTLDALLKDARWIEGVPFMSLEKLRTWKVHTARPKDVRHIELIDRYLAGHA